MAKYQSAAVTVELLQELRKVLNDGFTSDSERVRYAVREFIKTHGKRGGDENI